MITDANGTLLESYSFDAWGKRRAINSWDPLSAAEIQTHYASTDKTTNRGYTGHEQMYEVGLIHMNGRIYDPMLGRVLQADPMIDGVGSTQGYNRYSYVHNNPLAYTDPSGFLRWNEFRDKWLKPIVAIVISIYMPTMMAGAWGWAAGAAAGTASVAAYAVTGFVAGAVATGTLRGAALGAFSGYVFGSIGATEMGNVTRMGAHAMAGGVMSVLQGGKFGHGFISAGITKGVGLKLKVQDVFTKGVVMSMLGGTLTKASGGKFAHGATTAAFAYAFNELQQRAAEAKKELFSLKFHTGKLKLSLGLKNVASGKASLSINAAEQVEGAQFRVVNGVELSGELRGTEYKLIDLKEYNNSESLINNSFSKNITVKNFDLSNQDIIFKFDFGGYLFGFDSKLNVSEGIRRVSD